MRELLFAPEADAKLDSLHASLPHVADVIEGCLDWIENDDPRARRRRFDNGLWALTCSASGSEWLILWDSLTPGVAAIRFIGETVSL